MKTGSALLWPLVLLPLQTQTSCKQADKGPAEQPNVLFILVDDLGKEWISAYGADSVRTPAIDRLAQEGILFTNAYSMPQCTPSRITFLTGKYPYNHGWVNHFDVPRWGHGARFDPERNTTVINLLKDNGYQTCAAGKWQINDFRLEPDAMEKAGFDDYFMWTGVEGGNEAVSQNRYWDPYIHDKAGSRVYPGSFGPDLFTGHILTFMRKNRDKPMFIYYPMVLTHGPLTTTPAEPDVKSDPAKHQAMVRYTDFLVGSLLNELDSLHIREKTYVFFVTDNGTASNIIGSRDSRAIRGGKTYLTENGVNAPLIISCPGKIPEGERSDVLVDFTDFFPTILELCGTGSTDPVDGRSFSSVLRNNEQTGQRDWILAMGSHSGKIGDNDRMENWYTYRDRVLRDRKFKVYIDTSGSVNRIFNLEQDPFEEFNLIRSADPEVDSVLTIYEAVIGQLPDTDNQPDYEKLDTAIYNIPPVELEESHRQTLGKSNMAPPAFQKKTKKNSK